MRATRAVRISTLAALIVGASLVTTSVWTNTGAPAASPPNIVVIMTDDQWTGSMAYMPKTNALLVDNGVSFSNYHVSNPLCCPSRSTYLTGQYSHTHGVESNSPPNGGFQKFDDTSTLATWLNDAGYHTTLIGKYLNGYGSGASATYIPPGWDNWLGATQGTQLLYDYTLNENGTPVQYGSAPADFKTDVFASKAVANINARAGLGPFFMTVQVTAPHNEFNGDNQSVRAAPRHEGIFANEPFPVKKSFNETDVTDKPQWVQDQPLLTQAGEDTIAQSWRDKLEGLQSVDDLVGSVVEALDAQGVLDDTIILFTSDNGFFFGEHRIPGGKNRVYEEATRVPLVIRGARSRAARPASRSLPTSISPRRSPRSPASHRVSFRMASRWFATQRAGAIAATARSCSRIRRRTRTPSTRSERRSGSTRRWGAARRSCTTSARIRCSCEAGTPSRASQRRKPRWQRRSPRSRTARVRLVISTSAADRTTPCK